MILITRPAIRLFITVVMRALTFMVIALMVIALLMLLTIVGKRTPGIHHEKDLVLRAVAKYRRA